MVVETPTSNPLPPPPRRRNDGGSSSRQENLSNADFRRMVMETPRRAPPDESSKDQRPKKKNADESAKRPARKFRPPKPKEEEKKPTKVDEEDDLPKYRDRAKERREDQNPDYELMAAASGISTLHAVAPPGAVDLQAAEIQKKISIANSKYLGGDVEHTHLVKGLDYALLNKVRSEIDKKPEELEEPEEEIRVSKSEDEPIKFNTPVARVIYKWLVKPPTLSKTSDMFLPGRMAYAFDMEEMSHHIPTTVYRSKDDCPTPEEFVTVGVDVAVLDRIAKIMAYLKLGASGKTSKKKRRDKSDTKGTAKEAAALVAPIDVKQPETHDDEVVKDRPSDTDDAAVEEEAPKPRVAEDDIFADAGTDYVVTIDGSPRSEDMEESPRRDGNGGASYFHEEQRSHEDWEQAPMQGPAMPQFGSEWQDYLPPPPDDPSYEYYANQLSVEGNASVPAAAIAPVAPKDPLCMTQEEKDRGMSSVFKRDDQRLRQRRELDSREKDPNFVSESYSECYPGYQEYNREIVDSDEDADLTKMDVGGRAKGRLHRWDFETEEEWGKYNDQKEATPKAAYQFGVKMQDGRKTRKQNKDQKLNNELHKITQIMEKKKREKGGLHEDGDIVAEESSHPGKRIRT
ncbi:suppressor of mec-8 and unc-52 protein homolog 2 [Selaginella moellendorffii]|uniref:suppressor of mec-8 and unc-52 protein homolog 2 n=1 Tax=Selaginella moellendorffii TaxID=88036 RepID=UPI000D1C6190|nr:suppressor of mec-8 and unc-52 protein homolog 2 [Selaginella moellendorffii]|eukprot:XP_024515176.1 suppressor of mec-8 and unc-52 protein homolog 2 [Selaginella moellendorffii]